jgi:hypothetical protein
MTQVVEFAECISDTYQSVQKIDNQIDVFDSAMTVFHLGRDLLDMKRKAKQLSLEE